MKTVVLKAYHFNLLYAEALIADLSDAQMCLVPSKGLENHPAFTLGHLITGSALMSKYLNGVYDVSPEWDEIFRRKGPGDPRLPETDVSKYPSKEMLWKSYTAQHEKLEQLILELDEERFKETTHWRFEAYMPTLGDLLFFMCITHESMHLGQLAAWRRSVGLSSALVKL